MMVVVVGEVLDIGQEAAPINAFALRDGLLGQELLGRAIDRWCSGLIGA